MKKSLAVILIGLLVLGGLVLAFAEDTDTPAWFDDMLNWRKAQIEQALEDDLITEDEAQAWYQHLEDMQAYHQENGFTYRNGGMFGRGRGNGMFNNGTGGFKPGFGPCHNQ